MIDLPDRARQLILPLLEKYAPGCEVWAFGSRVNATAHPYSDLDLVLIGPAKIDWRQIEALKDALSESDLPIQVDILDWHALSPQFQEVIRRNHQLFSRG